MISGITVTTQSANKAHLSSLDSQRSHVALASLALFVGLSAANAMGGFLQFAFFGLCAVVLLLRRHRLPVGLLGGALFCGAIATLCSLQTEFNTAPFLRFVRPFIEGYMLAVFLYRVCNIHTLESLLAALAGYVLLQLIGAAAMAALPNIRVSLLDLWYGDESYDGQALRAALLFRGFGVSRHFLFGLPLALGTISALLLVGASLERRPLRRGLLIGFAFACVLLILPNARIGLVPILACYALGISLFFRFFYLRQLLVMFGIGVPLLLLIQMYLGNAGDILVAWLLEGVIQFTDSSQASDSTTLTDLSNMVIFPADPLAWFIGDGRICQPGEGCYSDIGWIRLLQEGGLLLAIPVTLLYLTLALKIYVGLHHIALNQPRWLVHSSLNLLLWILLLTFVLATIKGEGYAPNDYSRLLITLATLVSQFQNQPKNTNVVLSASMTT